jgi:uncharacterized membrane protein
MRLRAPRLFAGLLVAVGLFFVLGATTALAPRLRALVAWDIGAVVALLGLAHGLGRAGPARLRRIAADQDAGAWAVLALTLAAAIASLAAIAAELPAGRNAQGLESALHIALVLGTIVLSWVLIQAVFAVHYAHEFHGAEAAPGMLVFPGDNQPTMADFCYFAFTIGMTFQTSDVQVGRSARLAVLGHAIVSFFYSTGVLAVAINLVATMIL